MSHGLAGAEVGAAEQRPVFPRGFVPESSDVVEHVGAYQCADDARVDRADIPVVEGDRGRNILTGNVTRNETDGRCQESAVEGGRGHRCEVAGLELVVGVEETEPRRRRSRRRRRCGPRRSSSHRGTGPGRQAAPIRRNVPHGRRARPIGPRRTWRSGRRRPQPLSALEHGAPLLHSARLLVVERVSRRLSPRRVHVFND